MQVPNWVEQDLSYNRWHHQHCHPVVSHIYIITMLSGVCLAQLIPMWISHRKVQLISM
jgi:hypothetical protein